MTPRWLTALVGLSCLIGCSGEIVSPNGETHAGVDGGRLPGPDGSADGFVAGQDAATASADGSAAGHDAASVSADGSAAGHDAAGSGADGSAAGQADAASGPDTGGPPPAAGLRWSDEFDSLSLASSSNPNGNWRVGDTWQDIDKGYQDFAGTNWNLNPARAPYDAYSPYSVQGGVLTIESFRTPAALQSAISADNGGRVPAWCGGYLVLNPAAYLYQYGYMEFRVRWSIPGKGMFPALWFYSLGEKNPASHGSDEIDMLEIYGSPSGSPWNQSVSCCPSRDFGLYDDDTTQWHTYGMDWQPSYIRFYFDGQQRNELTGSDATYFNNLYLTARINFAMDAPWFSGNGTASDASTPSPMKMEVDYVRVYDQKP
jgi:hypothetical protein